MVHVLKGLSGFVYSDEGGLNIGPAEEDAFRIYLVVSLFLCQHLLFFCTNSNRQKNPKASSYKNKGFPYYDQMAPLMPDNVGGTHTFHPSSQARGAASLGTNTPDEAPTTTMTTMTCPVTPLMLATSTSLMPTASVT